MLDGLNIAELSPEVQGLAKLLVKEKVMPGILDVGRRDPCGRSHRPCNGLPVELERQTSGQHQ